MSPPQYVQADLEMLIMARLRRTQDYDDDHVDHHHDYNNEDDYNNVNEDDDYDNED